MINAHPSSWQLRILLLTKLNLVKDRQNVFHIFDFVGTKISSQKNGETKNTKWNISAIGWNIQHFLPVVNEPGPSRIRDMKANAESKWNAIVVWHVGTIYAFLSKYGHSMQYPLSRKLKVF